MRFSSLYETPGMIITDFGRSLEGKSSTGTEVIKIGRYGVWKYNSAKGRHETIDTGDDLEVLKKKYGDLPVQKL